MNGKYATWKQPPIRRWILLLSSLVAVRAKAIIPMLTILSSTIPTSHFQSTSSIFHSSENSSINGSNEIGPSAIVQQLCDEASTGLDIDFPTFDSDVDDETLRNRKDNDVGYTQRIDEANEGTSQPLVSIVTTTTTTASLIMDDIASIRLPADPADDTSIVKLVESQPTHQMSPSTANAIFVYSLAIITGFGEICCLKSYGCFINMVTGSSVRIFMGIAEGQFRAIRLPICVTIGYVSGIIFARMLKYHFDSNERTINGIERQQKKQPLRTISKSRSKLKKSFLRYMTDVTPRQRSSSSDLLFSVAPLIIVLFSATELTNVLLHSTLKSSIVRIPIMFHVLLQAIGYGLVAQIMTDVQATPANVYVLTGHYVSVTKSFIDQYLQGQTKHNDDESSTTLHAKMQRLLAFVPTSQQRQSINIVCFFGIGTMISSLMYKYVAYLLPFQHTLTGIFYTLTFLWYSLRLSIAPPSN